MDRTELKRKQRSLSKAVKGSNNRKKKKQAFSREWQRVHQRKNGCLHEITSKLVKNQASHFFVEDLRIQNMVRNHKLAKAINEQQWGTFVDLLTYKAEEAGGRVEKVNPKNTSQVCNAFGCLPDTKLTLANRMYHCKHCGVEEDRDVNAAKNILFVGLSNESGGNSPIRRKEENYGGLLKPSHCVEQYT